MAGSSDQDRLMAVKGVIMTYVGEDRQGRPEVHVVLDRPLAQLRTPLPRTADGLPVHVFENKTVQWRNGKMVIADRDKTELAELQGDVLAENLRSRGTAEDFEAMIDHLIMTGGSWDDLVYVVEVGLRRYPTRAGLLDLATAVGFGLAQQGAHDAVAAVATALAKAAGSNHASHFNAAQMFEIVGSKRAAEREYEAALEYARTEEDRTDALEGLARLRRS